MDDFLKMDIFFLVTTIAVVILTVLMSYVLMRFIRLLGSLERIASSAEEEAERIKEDIHDLRLKTRKEGLKLRHIVKFLGGMGDSKKR